MHNNNNGGAAYHRFWVVVYSAVATVVSGIAIVMRRVAIVACGVSMVAGGVNMVTGGVAMVPCRIAMVVAGAIRWRRVVNYRIMRYLGGVKIYEAVGTRTTFKPNSNYISTRLGKRHIGCALYIGQVKQSCAAPGA